MAAMLDFIGGAADPRLQITEYSNMTARLLCEALTSQLHALPCSYCPRSLSNWESHGRRTHQP